jgi:hypothetical protein
MKFCNNCRQNVEPTKKFNWLVFICLCGICYVPVYLLMSKKCPMCQGENFGQPQAPPGNYQQQPPGNYQQPPPPGY